MRKARKFVLAAALVVAAVAVVLCVVNRRTTRGFEGVYLAAGGSDCMVIESDGSRTFTVRQPESAHYYVWRGSRRDSGMRLERFYHPDRAKMYGFNGLTTPELVLVLQPSAAVRGDWDAIRFGFQYAFRNPRPYPEPKPLVRTVPYLHRVMDDRVVEVFERVEAGDDRGGSTLARAVQMSNPDDNYLRMLLLCAAARAGEETEVRQRLDKWANDLETLDDPHIARNLRMLRAWLRSFELTRQGRNAYDFHRRNLDRDTNLEARVRRMPKVFDREAYVAPVIRWPTGLAIPNFLEIQVTAKVFRIIACFQTLEGGRSEALELLAATWWLGQLMSESDAALIEALIGTAVRAIAAAGLQIHVLNACETEAEFRQARDTLDRLHDRQAAYREQNILALVDPMHTLLRQDDEAYPRDAVTRFTVARTQLELARMALAARHRLVTAGDFPTTETQFAPFLPGGPPADPFSMAPLRFVRRPDAFVCYSIGPDRTDERAAVVYDPTNGTISAGDIVLEVPRKRRHPFPRDAVRAASAGDLRRQFPNGLPPDPFASNKGRGLSVAESANGDVFVWSYGPDVDEYKRANPASFNTIPATGTVMWRSEITTNHAISPHRLEVQYDPTNGIVSEGDLIWRVPPPEGRK